MYLQSFNKLTKQDMLHQKKLWNR